MDQEIIHATRDEAHWLWLVAHWSYLVTESIIEGKIDTDSFRELCRVLVNLEPVTLGVPEDLMDINPEENFGDECFNKAMAIGEPKTRCHQKETGDH